jgi:hypothetical protein
VSSWISGRSHAAFQLEQGREAKGAGCRGVAGCAAGELGVSAGRRFQKGWELEAEGRRKDNGWI